MAISKEPTRRVRVSLVQVAERAGVSSATVSRVLHGADARISSDTRRKVLTIADEMGYRVNRAARALVTGRTQTVALWMANLRNAYYSRVIYDTRQEVARHDYDLLIGELHYNTGQDRIDSSRLLAWPVDGILAVDLPADLQPGPEKGLLCGMPLTTVGVYVSEAADYVRVDLTAEVAKAVRHLGEVGCKRIAYLVPDWFDWFRETREPRWCGYQDTIARLGRQPEYILTFDEHRESVAGSLRNHIQRSGCPDGVFCFNDDMAMGAFRALRDLGLRIPQDVALVGCDGISETEYADPPITTIVQPMEELCAIAWTFLARRMERPDLPLRQETIQPRLSVRGSSLR